MTSTTSRTTTTKQKLISCFTYGCLYPVSAIILGGLIVLLLMYIQAKRLPNDAPLARMYRTEADIAVLAHAIEVYANRYHSYPPAGQDGLQRAINALSEKVPYFGSGVPHDPWGQPYRYIPHTQYEELPQEALKDAHGFFAPSSFQLYSLGQDGDPGISNPDARTDNITSWDETRPWRKVYKQRTKLFLK